MRDEAHWTARQWQTHERQKIKLMSSVQHYQDIGYTDEQIVELVTSLLDFNRWWAEKVTKTAPPRAPEE